LVDPLLQAYFSAYMKNAHEAIGIKSVNISSTTNHPTNAANSYHSIGLAFDINYIDGIHIKDVTNADNDAFLVQGIYDMQQISINLPGWVENYGPGNVLRMINDVPTYWPQVRETPGRHEDHIHISIFPE